MAKNRKYKKRELLEQKRNYEEYQRFFSWVIAERKFISFLYELISEADSKYYEWYNSIIFFLMNFGKWEDDKGFIVGCTKEEFTKQFDTSYANMKKIFEVEDSELDKTMMTIKDKFVEKVNFRIEE